MHTQDLDLNAIRQLVLRLKTDIARIHARINQTPESIGDPAVDPNWTPPESST